MERHLNKKARRSSHKNHIRGPKKRTEENDERFCQSMEKIGINGDGEVYRNALNCFTQLYERIVFRREMERICPERAEWMEVNKSKYQLEYYRNYGICDQCGAVILLLDKALSYNGDEQQNLQSFLDRNAIFFGISQTAMSASYLKKMVAL